MLTDRSRIARPIARMALCSSLAIATALVVGPGLAQAQSFQGTGTVVAGSATITPATNSTTISGISTDAVIDWTTFDTATGGGPIDFQPSGTTATFTSTNDFSVLNRIFPTDPSRAIQFNGTIIGQIQSTTTIPGGDVYFYSPGGVIVGSTAVFNVGNLGLTSIAPAVVGGQFVQGANTEFVQFNGAVRPGSSVAIQAGAQINAGNAGNQGYVTVVAPMIDQHGTINTNGGAALISADAATITFNPTGLFDIQVTSGTSGTGTTLFNNGTITGPAFSGTGINHRIYMVAVPKNDAITMAIASGSTLGFNIAGAANTVGNAVVLSGGFDIVGGQAAATPSVGSGSGQVDTFADPNTVTSAISIASTGRALLFANSGRTANYASDVSVSGATPGTSPTTIAAQVGSFDAGSQLNIAGNLSVTALDPKIVAPASGLQLSNDAVVDANGGGNMTIGGNVTISNNKTGTLNQNVVAGSARLAANSGSVLTVGGNVTISAVGQGGLGNQANFDSTGFGTGGSASIFANTGATVSIAGNVVLDANGLAGAAGVPQVDGGLGQGGFVTVSASDAGSRITVGGSLTAAADGVGADGSGCTICDDDGGPGFGGTIGIRSGNGAASLDISGAVIANARGFGGNSLLSLAGEGRGGSVNVSANQGSATILRNSVSLNADGIGGRQLVINGSSPTGMFGGGAGNAGQAEFGVFMGGNLTVSGAASASAQGFGGASRSANSIGGFGRGGIAQVYEDSTGSIGFGSSLDLNARGTGGGAQSEEVGFSAEVGGGAGTGGQARVISYNTGSASITVGGNLSADASGTGGRSTCVTCGAAGGQGTGGIARIGGDAANKTITIAGQALLAANGNGGVATGTRGGVGVGGISELFATGSTINLNSTGPFNVFATGFGGSSTSGAAGNGNGGVAQINVTNASAATIGGNTSVIAAGLTGNGTRNSAAASGGTVNVFAQQNSTLGVTGNLVLDSSGVAGVTSQSPAIKTGTGFGGTATLTASSGGSVNVSNVLRFFSAGIGTDGGNATGGTANFTASGGGTIASSELSMNTVGFASADTGIGSGFGRGGNVNVTASGIGSSISVANGNSTGTAAAGELDFITATGFGGQNNGAGSGIGGAAFGGNVAINVNSGATFSGPANTGTQGFVRILARATGGNADTGATAGGNATGGAINITIDNATMTSANMLPSSFAMGGSFATGATGNIAGGNATGGLRNITVTNGGSLTTQFGGGGPGAQGGNGLGTGRGGDGTGGSASLVVDNGSTLSLTGSSTVFSQNSGGAGGSAGIGGNGTAGSAFVRVANGSTLTMSGPTTNTFGVHATAFGSFSPTTSLTGSNSTGGNSTFVIENATANLQAVNVTATGTGGGGLVTTGGNGTGGNALLQLTGATLTADSVIVSAVGSGGSLDIGQSGVAGNGTGGLARLIATGGTSTATIAQSIGIGADGLGGDIGGAAGTTTGNGVGGRAALVVSNGASLTLNVPDVFLAADGEGGEAPGPADIGGDGTGGAADVFANGGNLTINGNLELEADNDGGEGLVGGDGLRRTDGLANALLRAQNGSITVTGSTRLASVGEADSGGSASGGLVLIDPQNNLAGPSTITLNNLIMNATAVGGNGAAAPSPSAPGGDGGDAFGGQALALGSAGNGRLVINGSTVLDASATGGTGGTGHPGATGTAGGRGGDATGGNIQFGTKSAADTGALNIGSARFGAVSATADATGGAGGVGGSGTVQGVGGAGGDAQGGGVTLLVRGSPATFTGPVALSGDSSGGAGGAGSTQGVGGSATVGNAGGLAILATSRFMQPTQRGSLTAGTISGSAIATGGAGSTMGASVAGDLPLQLEFSSASGTVGSIDLLAGAGTTTGTIPSHIRLTDGTLDIATHLNLSTPGNLEVTLDRFTVNVPNLSLDAGNFVLNPVRPTTLGTFNVTNSLNLFSGLDLLAYANFDAFGSGIFEAGGNVLFGDLTVDDDLFIEALGSITTGAILAGEDIDLDAGGAVTAGQLTAGGSVAVTAGGAANVFGASAGIVDPSTDPDADYNIALRSLTSLNAGNLTARGSVGVASAGQITVGNVVTGPGPLGLGFLALAGTGLTTGSIDTTGSTNSGQVYLTNFSMESLGGVLGNNFDPAPIVAMTPVAIGGPVALNGPVSTGRFQAATTGAFSAQAITAPNLFQLAAGTDVTLGDISSFIVNVSSALSLTLGAVTSTATSAQLAALGQSNGVTLTAANGALATGAISSNGSIDLIGAQALTTGAVNVSAGSVEMDTNGALLTGAVTSGQSQRLFAGTTATTGNLVAGTNPESQFSVGVAAGGAVTTGSISASRDVGLLSQTAGVSTQAITSGTSVGVLTRGPVTLGNVTTGTASSNYLYIANASMAPLGGALGPNFNPAPIFATAPTATTGPIVVGSVSGANVVAATTQSIAFGAINGLAVRLGAGLGISTGSIAARGDLGLQAAQAISTGNIAGRDVLLLAGTSVSTGRIDALAGTQPIGRVLIGNVSMATPSANVFTSFAALPLLNTLPVRTSGPITIGGSVTAGTLKAATAQAFSAGAITLPGSSTFFSGLVVDSGQTITVNGAWRGDFINLASNDIDITSTGSLTGFVNLLSRNSNGVFIGDGTSGSGYMLSNAEFNRISGGLEFEGIDTSQAVDMLFGNLAIDATKFSNDDEAISFSIGDDDSSGERIGRIRVDGNITATGASSTNGQELGIAFSSKIFELNAATGSVTIANAAGGLGGTIEIDAENIHVADDAILTKLRADPFYTGHVAELNAPAAIQRPEGVLRASSLELEGDRTIYIQNTGSAIAPAGFVTRVDGADDDGGSSIGPEDGESGPGGVKIVINGQVQTDTALLTGKAAFDLIIAQARSDLDPGEEFAADLDPTSTLNGCVITTGVCAFGQSDPVAAISSEITVVTNATLDESPVAPAADDSDEGEDASSEQDDEDAEADEGSSPIAPPTPLISTRALDGDVTVVEPVSGAGNPALFGSAVDETTVQGETP